MILAILHGVVLAFGLIIPLGAQNVFVFNQGATQPTLLRALPVVVTAAICDTLLITLSVLGISLIVLQLQWLQLILFTVGIIFLAYMGWSVWTSDPTPASGPQNSLSSKQQIAFATSVSLLNPHAILDTVGVIGTSSLQYVGTEKMVFALACIVVSWSWFIGLALAGRWLGRIDSKGKILLWINKFSALIIWGVAIYLAWNLIGG